MKLFSDAKQLSPAAARNCFLLNQFATPGLGSLVGGRYIAGMGQLALAIIGFAIFILGFWLTMKEYYNIATGDQPAISYAKYFFAGASIFALSWLWSLVTSLSLMRQAKPPELAPLGALPPRITNPPPKM